MAHPTTPPPFKVIIVGGSVTGLTLAHALTRLGVDFVLLEKRACVAPQEGASIGILPNGARVLDQLGLYDAVAARATPMGVSDIHFPDGFCFPSAYPKKMMENFGYPIAFMERRALLETLHAALPEKSKVRVGTTVSAIEQADDDGSIRVHTTCGAVHSGDLVVGADGVHSTARAEMWRMAQAATDAAAPVESIAAVMTVDYSCIFGMSSALPGLMPGEQVLRIGDGWTIVVIPGSGRVVFWFVVRKLDRPCGYADAPRYTPADAADHVARYYMDVPLGKGAGLTFGDLWAARQTVNMTPLQESVFRHWSHGRLVCIGDAVHKQTINLGQGANCAIEDVAVLANLLKALLQSKFPKPSGQEVDALLRRFNEAQLPRVAHICALSYMTTRVHARDGAVRRLLGRYVMPNFGALLESRPFGMIADAAVLEFLPVPKSDFAGWEKYRSKGRGKRSPLVLVLSGACLAFLAVVWNYYMSLEG